MGLQLSPSDRAALLALTEGWAAGLHLAALAVRGQAEGARRINCLSGAQRFVLDYQTDEVLDRQPGVFHNFLVRTSILDRLSGPLVDAALAVRGGEPRALTR